jgi:hypothetical protein
VRVDYAEISRLGDAILCGVSPPVTGFDDLPPGCTTLADVPPGLERFVGAVRSP